MASVVIVSTQRLIKFDFGDQNGRSGYDKIAVRKDKVSPVKLANNHVDFNADNGGIRWRLAHAGGPKRLKVDTVDGVAPTDVPDLYDKILDILG